MGAWPEREAPAERIASVVLAVEKGMDSSIPFSVALYFFSTTENAFTKCNRAGSCSRHSGFYGTEIVPYATR